ncbi:hypothetical protein Aph01nite_26970 [Acrocarpospora phusangensis]|uniref:DUF1330 domain-containing protein n=1 Tax=Acrocarpospora phusangensis TaxID=1070424 RepID=A0A919QDQ8_9ACTN|nr:hypothetical protein Aph01nite_26970 [Acrocarpospora phusangensis]
MSAYLINHLRIPGDVPNDQLRSYLQQVEGIVTSYGGKWLANGEGTAVEGVWPGRVVLLEFPDLAAIDRWAASPEYQRVVSLRLENAISDVVVVDGLPAA